MTNDKTAKPTDPKLDPKPPSDHVSTGQLTLEAAFKKYRPVAETLDPSSVRSVQADLSLALQNAERAIAWLPDKKQEIAGYLPTVNFSSLFELPDVIRATIHAQSLIPPDLGGSDAASKAAKARRKSSSSGAISASELRDRLWSLALVDYANLWRVAAFLFGPEAIGQYVPPLLALPVKRKSTVPPGTD